MIYQNTQREWLHITSASFWSFLKPPPPVSNRLPSTTPPPSASGANPGEDGGYSSPQRFRTIPPPINICFHPPNKNMFPFPKNRLTYTHVIQH